MLDQDIMRVIIERLKARFDHIVTFTVHDSTWTSITVTSKYGIFITSIYFRENCLELTGGSSTRQFEYCDGNSFDLEKIISELSFTIYEIMLCDMDRKVKAHSDMLKKASQMFDNLSRLFNVV